ncbi:hypothetical protein GCM10023091_22070 [Ravibacter arvi]|uniref:2'-5' RNA ligase n=1 Tax=Ravibacter arvi TaxID=2051041 RepID=A0ABP8M168_9BACT
MIYSLAIMPAPPIAEKVKNLKQLLRVEIGKSYGSANADAHISLDSFEADESHYPLVLVEYRRILAGLSPFPVEFSGYGHFDGYYPAFFVRLKKESEEAVKHRYKIVRETFGKPIRKQYMRKWQDESKAPHMTIGRRLTPEWINLAYSIFPEFEAHSECTSFVIRRYNEQRRQYDVIDTIPLLGRNREAGTQLSLV